MFTGARDRGRLSRAVLALALLALALKILVAPGFMAGSSRSLPIAICSGQGPAATTGPDDHGQPAKAPQGKTDGICPFAGHGATPLPPHLTADAPPCWQIVPVRASFRPQDLAPGRGLAAPPPPSHAPPALVF